MTEDDDLIPVRAPAAGVILTRSVTPGTVVTPATDQFLITDLSHIWAIAEVPEEYLSKLRVGMTARVFVQAYGVEAFVGRIGKIGDTLDPVTRTVKVRLELPNVRGRLKPEMYAKAEIQIGSTSPVITLTRDALQDIRGHTSVFVKVAEDRFEVRPVQTGRSFDNTVEVAGPLGVGDKVAVRATFILKSEFLKASLAGE